MCSCPRGPASHLTRILSLPDLHAVSPHGFQEEKQAKSVKTRHATVVAAVSHLDRWAHLNQTSVMARRGPHPRTAGCSVAVVGSPCRAEKRFTARASPTVAEELGIASPAAAVALLFLVLLAPASEGRGHACPCASRSHPRLAERPEAGDSSPRCPQASGDPAISPAPDTWGTRRSCQGGDGHPKKCGPPSPAAQLSVFHRNRSSGTKRSGSRTWKGDEGASWW